MFTYFLTLNMFFIYSLAFDPEMNMTVSQIIQRWGYPVEELEVMTEDGYFITIHRVRQGVNSSDSGCFRPPVLMDHSLLCDASEFVMNPPASSPAMELADAGFDVFLMNHRGSTYSRKHRKLNTNESDYWKFTIDEHAKYDNPAAIDLVLNVTGEQSIYFVGHSQIRALFQVAPATTWHTGRGVSRLIVVVYQLLKPLLEICHDWMQFTLGTPARTFNYSRWPIYVSHLPSSTSTWNFLHWLQMATHNKLERFDHSPSENMKRYGQATPLAYDLSLVQAPVYIFWSESDWLVTGTDIKESLLPKLNKDVLKGVYEVLDYDHLDFVMANDNKEKVFDRIISEVRKKERDMCEH